MVFFSKNDFCEQVIRVNHAGEYAAVNIYRAQSIALKFTNVKLHCVTNEMLKHEQVHYDFFNNKIMELSVRPTIFLPLWKVLSFGLGFTTGILGKNAVATCTVAVEEVIERHYESQLDNSDYLGCTELKSKISEFLEDERSHKNFAQKENFIIRPLADVIKIGCKVAIFLSKHF